MANRWGNSGNSDRLYFLYFKITADGDCSHEINRCLLLGRKAMTSLDSVLKIRDITLQTKVHMVKAMVFPVVMYRCEWSEVKWSEVTQSCLTLCDPMNRSTPGLPVHHHLPALTQMELLMSIESVIPSSHLILCHLLILRLSSFPSIRVFSKESAVHIRWPKYWSFSFSISTSYKYSGLISFRIDWFHLLASKGLSRVFSNTTVQNHLGITSDMQMTPPWWQKVKRS